MANDKDSTYLKFYLKKKRFKRAVRAKVKEVKLVRRGKDWINIGNCRMRIVTVIEHKTYF